MHLRTLRNRREMTQDDLAAKSKVPQATISRLETTSHVQPKMTIVAALAKALGADPFSIEFGPPRRRRRAKLTKPPVASAPPAPPPAPAV